MLISIQNGTTHYTHNDFADWCGDYIKAAEYHHISINTTLDKKAVDIAYEVDLKWEGHLINSLAVHELSDENKSTLEMPKEWFKEWLMRLKG